MFSGWRSASYDAALDDISKNMPKKAGDVRNFKTTLNDYIKQNYKSETKQNTTIAKAQTRNNIIIKQ